MSPLVGAFHFHHHLYKVIPTIDNMSTTTNTHVLKICVLNYLPLLCGLTHSAQSTPYLVIPLTPDHVLWLLPSFHFPPTKGNSRVPYILNVIHVSIHPSSPPFCLSYQFDRIDAKNPFASSSHALFLSSSTQVYRKVVVSWISFPYYFAVLDDT
jgi:hypothetical protein